MYNQTKYLGLYFLPSALIVGPFLSDFIISIYALYFLYFSIKEKLFYYYKNYFFYLFIFFYSYILLRSLLSGNPLLSLESSLFYFRYYLFIACIAHFIEKNKKFIFNFGVSIFIPILIVSFDAYFQLITSFNITGLKRPDSLHITSFFGSEMILGQYIARLSPLLIATMLYYDDNKKLSSYIFVFIILILTTSVSYISGERTAFFISVLSFVMYALLIRNFIGGRLIFLISLIGIIVSISFLFPNTHNRIFNHTLTQIDYQEGNFYVFSKKHQSIYETSLEMIKDKPLFGYGPKMYREECKRYENSLADPCSTHPHNSYLQLLSETGIIGFIPFFIILIILVRRVVIYFFMSFSNQSDKEDFFSNYEISLLIALSITFFPLIPSLNFFNNWISIIYYLPAAFLLNINKVKK